MEPSINQSHIDQSHITSPLFFLFFFRWVRMSICASASLYFFYIYFFSPFFFSPYIARAERAPSNLQRRQSDISFSNLLRGCALSPARRLHVLDPDCAVLIWPAVRAWSGSGQMEGEIGAHDVSAPSWRIKSPIRAKERDVNARGLILPWSRIRGARLRANASRPHLELLACVWLCSGLVMWLGASSCQAVQQVCW